MNPYVLSAAIVLLVVLAYAVGSWHGQTKLLDKTIRRRAPEVAAEVDRLIQLRGEYEPLRQDLDRRRAELVTLEVQAKASERRAAQLQKELDSLTSDEQRRRIVWLAEQLAAHLHPEGIAVMVSRDRLAVEDGEGAA